ncbi:ZYRO0G15972p [Zygosaccharomyces rouxii]|uniref:ZYRO0G15972p n=1 Tax=Zygosaccharomyces rouxii (strain ATCC 2623 / CBS 732 / NBRC 1130 / NCYC 568 / NRRL Y-229) TaxID=559307 RepID=C5E0V7_ZYGRC|nr:uncharacterized protein ZYRO0G15972g [Zygosaccharomyces rouxii]KAH9202733.1 hypothetical protein LQ764DRAFT_51508 [Zygosaccharomyces rouxii]CAR29741.1 ZYRO0G15972p [Zygosaccharomyces rouxii]
MNEADVFLQALQGGDSNSGDPFMLFGSGSNSVSEVDKLPGNFENSQGPSPKDRGPSNQFEPMSLTPESYHSFYEDPSSANMSFQFQQQPQQLQQPQQQNFSRNSIFDVNGFEKPQQQSQGDDAFALGRPNNGYVKSEFSPKLSSGTDDNKSNNGGVGSIDGDGDVDGESDDLVKDEFGFNLDETPSTEEFSKITTKSGKVIKKRKEKTSHNVIEKKYRTNINDKIFQLRAIVPALRVAYKRHAGIPVVSKDLADLDGLQPARKLNKASILMKTIEYITYLENKCDNYMNENKMLKNNIPTPQSTRSHSLPQQQQQQQQQRQQPQSSSRQTVESAMGAGFGQFGSPMYSTIPTSSSAANGISTDGTATAATTTSSTNDFQSSSEFDPQSVEEDDNNNGDFTSKLLMGCFGVSMGAQAFGGDGGEMGSARALFAMPIFHFSPKTGFVVSNSNGVVNLQASIFALLKIILVLATFVHLTRCFFFSNSSKSKKQDIHNDTISTVPYKDTVAFDNEDHLKETLKKTLVLNKLKYKHNSMERIESKIAGCFALTLYFKDSKLPWSYMSGRYVQNKWQEIKDQVVKANQKSQGTLSSGLEWEMITNVSTSQMNLTLNNEKLLNHLSSTRHEYEFKEFLSLINTFILNDTKESLLREFLDQISSSGSTNNDTRQQIAIKFCDNHVAESKLLQSMPEDHEVINCLIRPTRSACEKLLKLVKINNESPSEHSLEEQLVLYSSVMRYFIANEKFSQCTTWLQNKPLHHLNQLDSKELSFVSFTALFLMVNDIMQNLDFFKGELTVLESLYKELRIWLGRESGNALGFEVRSRLIDYCIDQALVCGSLANEDMSDGSTDLEFDVSEDEQEQPGEINHVNEEVVC